MTLRGGEEESCEQWGRDALSRGSLLVCPTPGSPGVVEAVPLAGHGALAVGCVVSPHGGARVVGDGVEVVNGVVCGEQGCCSALLPPKVPAQSPPPHQQLQHPGFCASHPSRLCPTPPGDRRSPGVTRSSGLALEACRGWDSLQLCEANSRRSRSFSGKLTKVVSLLLRILASEKRFRSGGSRQGAKGQRGACNSPSAPTPNTPCPHPSAQRIRSTRILGNFWMLNFFVHLFLALQRQHVCGRQTAQAGG